MRSPNLVVCGQAVKAAREMAGLTQDGLAKAVEVTRAAVAQWESGRTQPSAGNFHALCKALHVEPESLLAVPDDKAA